MKSPLLPALLAPVLTLVVSCDRQSDIQRSDDAAEKEAALNLKLEIQRERLELERARLELDRDRALDEAARAKEALEAAKGEQAIAEARARAAEAERTLAELNAREGIAKAEREAAEKISKAEEAARAKAESQPGKAKAPIQALPLQHQAPGYRPGPDYSLFYEQLAPHGAWFQTIEYGYVWQPDAGRRDRSWRPYTVGRWLDTDQGWAWWSEEPFGWATYHYGRWTEFDRIGWIWVPGPDWAPAWVSWRVSDSHIGWAPLPPVTVYERNFNYGDRTDAACGIPPHHYNFVPTRAFAEPVRPHTLPPTQSITLVQQTVNVTHIHVREETVFVEGPRPEPLRRQFGDRLPRHTIDRREEWDTRTSRDPAPRREAGRIEYSAPHIVPAPEANARPSLLAGILEQLIPAHATPAPDAGLVQNFVRERAKLGAKSTPAPQAPRPQSPQTKGKEQPNEKENRRERVPPGQKASPPKSTPKSALPSESTPKSAPPATPPQPIKPDATGITRPAPSQIPDPAPVEPAPMPKPAPVPDPEPAPAEPAPMPKPAPVPDPEPAPAEPAPMPKPAPVPDPEPAPAEPAPMPKPAPAPDPEPAPAPDPEPAPAEPTPMPQPAPVPDPEPAPAEPAPKQEPPTPPSEPAGADPEPTTENLPAELPVPSPTE